MSQGQDEQVAVWDWDEEATKAAASGPKPGTRWIVLRVCRIALPVTLAFVLVVVLNHGGDGSSPQINTYPADSIAESVAGVLASNGLPGTTIHCADAAQAAGSVSHCTMTTAAGQATSTFFDVHFTDLAGDYTFTLPGSKGAPTFKGQLCC